MDWWDLYLVVSGCCTAFVALGIFAGIWEWLSKRKSRIKRLEEELSAKNAEIAQADEVNQALQRRIDAYDRHAIRDLEL